LLQFLDPPHFLQSKNWAGSKFRIRASTGGI
jgi:hypothetical protein